ncbi:zona pellucida-binding protein 2-like isoform X1 [Scyliorhinus canicula]|uniref:zona pellucida-binding protein 2-like isoform X1 n=1 Tax=Scyliorhinus canicula TaxID=7830 RepID=UPI0018F6E26E|nr:zona pellucida-binding protein 2-like isoform X1 [Scyliorhinus canicula]
MRSSRAAWQQLRVTALAVLLCAVPGRTIEFIGITQNQQEQPEQIIEVYGNSNRPVKVYVKMYHDSPALLCATQELSEKELVDPYFIWVGPSGRNIKGEPYVRISETGSLMLKSFDKLMSGDYTCTVSYKDVEKNKELFLDMKFSIYGFREPDYSFKFSTRYHTHECHDPSNNRFFRKFKSVEKELIADLTCRIPDVEMKCHVVKLPHKGLITELFIAFKVDPFGFGWEEICNKFIHDCEDETNRRVEKARNRIEAFFKKQSVALEEMKDNTPTFYYIANSLNTVRLDHCRPGFGKNKLTHLDCSECCVVCDHGMYSPNNDMFCKPCTSVKINYYGATAC